MLHFCLLQVEFRLIPRLKTKRKSAPMHRHRLWTLQILVNQHCLLWVHVWGLHYVTRKISTNGQNRKVERTKCSPYLLENLAIGSVSRVEYFLAFWCLDDKTSPKPWIFFIDFSFGPMANRDKSYLECMTVDLKFLSLGPVHFYHSTAFRKFTLWI